MAATTLGRDFIANAIINGGTATAGQALTWYNNANAALGVGDSTTAFAAAQTDLQAATNKLRKGMEATFPSVAVNVISFKSSFATGEANWVWNEWGIFNAASGVTMLSRKVEALGTKASGTWTLTVDFSLA